MLLGSIPIFGKDTYKHANPALFQPKQPNRLMSQISSASPCFSHNAPPPEFFPDAFGSPSQATVDFCSPCNTSSQEALQLLLAPPEPVTQPPSSSGTPTGSLQIDLRLLLNSAGLLTSRLTLISVPLQAVPPGPFPKSCLPFIPKVNPPR